MCRLVAPTKSIVKSLVYRPHGGVKLLSFEEGGSTYTLLVPDDHVWNMAREHVLSRIYERQGWLEFSDIQGGVIDAGAHSGFFTVLASCYAPWVVSLEVNPRNAAILRANCEANALKNVTVLETALWSSDGEIRFAPGEDSGSGLVEHDKGEKVQSVSLSTLLSSHPAAAVLKLDIEGAEFEVIRSTTDFGELTTIVGELHRPTSSPEVGELRRHLTAHGFEVDIVEEQYFYGTEMWRRAVTNMRNLRGEWRTKALLWPYFAVARFNGRQTALPGLFARRR